MLEAEAETEAKFKRPRPRSRLKPNLKRPNTVFIEYLT